MLAHRLRRWPNIETALGECLVFAGMTPLYKKCIDYIDSAMDW